MSYTATETWVSGDHKSVVTVKRRSNGLTSVALNGEALALSGMMGRCDFAHLPACPFGAIGYGCTCPGGPR